MPPVVGLSQTGERSAKGGAAAGDDGESGGQRTHPESKGGQGYGQEGGAEASQGERQGHRREPESHLREGAAGEEVGALGETMPASQQSQVWFGKETCPSAGYFSWELSVNSIDNVSFSSSLHRHLHQKEAEDAEVAKSSGENSNSSLHMEELGSLPNSHLPGARGSIDE